MKRPGRILIVDDLEPWRKALSTTLQQAGFAVDSAATITEVREKLGQTFYHLIILDIRLVDADANNIEGIDLLKELMLMGLSEAISVIILSAYGTLERMRRAFKEYEVADFLSKDNFSPQTLLESVRQVFARKTHINLEMDIQWQKIKTSSEVILNLEIDGVRVKRNPALQGLIASELEDLLCRLFSDASEILVHPLATGMSSTGVLLVRPFYPTGGGREFVVKFGDAGKIQEEHANFAKYVQPFISGGRNTSALQYKRTQRLGGILYTFLGGSSHHLEDFGTFYRRASVAEINAMLDHLFFDTCSAWYANAGRLGAYNLTNLYQKSFGFNQKNLAHALIELQEYVQGGQKLIFKALIGERSFVNPLMALNEPPLMRSTYTCITHGDFNEGNVFIDGEGHSWLIDFQSTGPGHILRDIAQLDSVIRFILLAPQEATLEERLLMEEALNRPASFSQVTSLAPTWQTENQALAKTYAVIVHLRQLARRLVAQNPSDDISEYAIALFYNALNTLRFYGIPSAQRLHALLSASLLCERYSLEK